MDQFLAIVRQQLIERNMTVRELAEKANMGYPYVYRLLKGEHSPTMDRAQKLADALGISLQFTVGSASEKITA